MKSMDYCKYENGIEYLDQILDDPEPASEGEEWAMNKLKEKMRLFLRENQ